MQVIQDLLIDPAEAHHLSVLVQPASDELGGLVFPECAIQISYMQPLQGNLSSTRKVGKTYPFSTV